MCVCRFEWVCVCTSTSMSENAVEKTLISIKEEHQIREERDDNDESGWGGYLWPGLLSCGSSPVTAGPSRWAGWRACPCAPGQIQRAPPCCQNPWDSRSARPHRTQAACCLQTKRHKPFLHMQNSDLQSSVCRGMGLKFSADD